MVFQLPHLILDGPEALLGQTPKAPVLAEAPRGALGRQPRHGVGELGIPGGHELAGVVHHLATPG